MEYFKWLKSLVVGDSVFFRNACGVLRVVLIEAVEKECRYLYWVTFDGMRRNVATMKLKDEEHLLPIPSDVSPLGIEYRYSSGSAAVSAPHVANCGLAADDRTISAYWKWLQRLKVGDPVYVIDSEGSIRYEEVVEIRNRGIVVTHDVRTYSFLPNRKNFFPHLQPVTLSCVAECCRQEKACELRDVNWGSFSDRTLTHILLSLNYSREWKD